MMSDQINELATALAAFQGEVKPVIFDAVNPYFKSRYATLSALVDTASPVLSKNGLSVCQLCSQDGAIQTILMHKSGQWISSEMKLNPTKNDPQGVGSSLTYNRRYSYASILGLVSEADDDGNAATAPIKPLTASVQAVKEAVAAVKPTPIIPKASELEFKGVLLSSRVKEGTSKATGKPYKVTEYTVQSDLGQIDVSVFGSPIEANPGAEMTFFEFVKSEFKGKPQYKANKVAAVNHSVSAEELQWEE
jgi:hypothetical protein